jgi:hypothetical protein
LGIDIENDEKCTGPKTRNCARTIAKSYRTLRRPKNSSPNFLQLDLRSPDKSIDRGQLDVPGYSKNIENISIAPKTRALKRGDWGPGKCMSPATTLANEKKIFLS